MLLPQSGDVFMGWSDSDNPSTTEDDEYGEVLSTSYSLSYSHASPLCSPACPSNSAPNSISEVGEFFKARRKYAYRSPTSLVSPPLSRVLLRPRSRICQRDAVTRSTTLRRRLSRWSQTTPWRNGYHASNPWRPLGQATRKDRSFIMRPKWSKTVRLN